MTLLQSVTHVACFTWSGVFLLVRTMKTKICTKCGEEKLATLEFFGKHKQGKFGLNPRCKVCRRLISAKCYEDNKDYYDNYRIENKEQISQKRKKYYLNNKEKIQKSHKEYRDGKGKDKIKSRRQTKEYKERRNLRRQERYSNDPAYRLEVLCRNRINFLLNGENKSKATLELIGCSGEELKKYLEKQFVDGMNWDNHGDWHIDHIRPCASFDLSVPEQQQECFHYTNLRPLWAEENIKKGAKLDH